MNRARLWPWLAALLGAAWLAAGCATPDPAAQASPPGPASAAKAPETLRRPEIGLTLELPAGASLAPPQPAQPQLAAQARLADGAELRIEAWPPPAAQAMDRAWRAAELARLKLLASDAAGWEAGPAQAGGLAGWGVDYAQARTRVRRLYLPGHDWLYVLTLAARDELTLRKALAALDGLRLEAGEASPSEPAPPPPPDEPAAQPPEPAPTPAKPLDEMQQLYSLDPPSLDRLMAGLGQFGHRAKDPAAARRWIETAAWQALARTGLGLAAPERDWSRLRAVAVTGWRREPRSAAALRALGLAMLMEERPVKARKYLEAAAELDPGDGAALLALCLLPGGEPARRLELTQRALAAAPRLPAASLMVARALAESGQPEEAGRHYAAVLALQPDSLPANLELARLEMDDPRARGRAAARLAKALALEPALEAARFNLALVMLAQDRDAEALAQADQLCRDNPRDPAAHNLRGLALMKLGRHAQAREAFSQAALAGPDHAQAHFNLGAVCANHLKDLDCARRAFQRFLELEPQGERADKAKAWLARRGG